MYQRHAYRGFQRCPGTTPCSLSPTEASNLCVEEHGVAVCQCAKGYAGAQCLECPGGAANPCSGHGSCVGLVGGTLCACQPGYLGDACEHTCPGMGTTANRNDLVCFEEGVCRLDDTGLARCLCSGASNRYGDFCQFEQGSCVSVYIYVCVCERMLESVWSLTTLCV